MILAALAVVTTLAWAAPVVAQTDSDPDPSGVTVLDDDAGEAQTESQIVRDDDTSDRVARTRRDLIIIAAVTAVGLAAYVWHTSPARRLQVAAKRNALVPEGDDSSGS